MSDNLKKNDKMVAKKQAIIPNHCDKWMFCNPVFTAKKMINKEKTGRTYLALINGVLNDSV